MATYAELRGIFFDDTYRKKIEAALVDAATLVLLEDDGTANHANRIKFAFRIMEGPIEVGAWMARAVLLKNKAFTLAQITGATDASALTEVQALFNEFADHYSA